MESYQNETNPATLYVDEVGKSQLLQTVKWSKFIAIVGYVMLGLLVILGLMMGVTGASLSSYSALGSAAGSMVMVIYILMAILYFFPTYYLYKFSVLIKPALQLNDQMQFNDALRYQKMMFRFIGVMLVVILILYCLFFIFGLIMFATAASF